MSYNVKSLKKFDNELKKLEDRKEHVEKILNENCEMIEDYIENSMLNGNARIEDKGINITIEQLATYLLKSQDAESCRSGEFTFYETERDYRSRYKIGKNTYSTDMGGRDDISKIHYDSYEEECFLPPMHELFNFDTMTPEEKKSLIKLGLKEKDNEYSELRDTMSSAYEYIMDMLTDEKDRVIVDMLIQGRIEADIAKVVGINRPNVNKRIKRICENKI